MGFREGQVTNATKARRVSQVDDVHERARSGTFKCLHEVLEGLGAGRNST